MHSLRSTLAAALLLTTGALDAQTPARPYLGADLSFANEMQDCGAVFRRHGKPVDPFALIARSGGNQVRVRIWNDATWTRYSGLADVERTIRRARAAGLQVLDFHYSDDWADGEKQIAPAAWAGLAPADQAKALHDYTRHTLDTLAATGLMPDLVQVGNETNGELLAGKSDRPIDWARNAPLLNAGIAAVHEASAASGHPVRIMLHIAQPENAEPWFAAATAAGVRGYDLIGLSYYRKWSKESMPQPAATIERLRAAYGVDVMVVETAYPYTLTGSGDTSPNVLGADSVEPGYPATPVGQRDYMVALTRIVLRAGGVGVVYWAPDWISTRCKTRWGTGSTWENATWFDVAHDWNALPVTDFLRERYPAR